jgi:hypothetical protein
MGPMTGRRRFGPSLGFAGLMEASSDVAWWSVCSACTSQAEHRVAAVFDRQRPIGTRAFTTLWDGLGTDSDLQGGETIAATSRMTALDEAGMALHDAIPKARAKKVGKRGRKHEVVTLDPRGSRARSRPPKRCEPFTRSPT